MTEVQPREIKILETAEDIQQRREEVLGRYGAFKQAISGRYNFIRIFQTLGGYAFFYKVQSYLNII